MSTLDSRQADRNEGERRKDAAHSLLVARRRVYVRRARRALLRLLLERETATADDIAEMVEPTPDGIDERWRGTVPGALAELGIIVDTGWSKKSSRPVAHARKITIWGLADRAAALAWLDRHPDLPDPDDMGAASPAPLSPIPTPVVLRQPMLF
jgi:hypothetical protein